MRHVVRKTTMPMLYLDITQTLRSGLNTGIQRVAKKIAEEVLRAKESSNLNFEVVFSINGGKSFLIMSELSILDSLKKSRLLKLKLFLTEIIRLNIPFEWYESKKKNSKILDLLYYHSSNLILIWQLKKYTFEKIQGLTSNDVFLCGDAFWNTDNDANRLVNVAKSGAKLALIVHDIFPISHPSWFEKRSIDLFTRNFERVLSSAQDIYCVSEFTLSQLDIFFPKNRIRELQTRTFFELGSDFIELDLDEEPLPKIPNKIIMVGTIEPRKNYRDILLWFEKYGDNFQLTIVGKSGWRSTEVMKQIKFLNNFNSNFKYIERCSDAELRYLLLRSNIGVCSSIAEGYGLPLREFRFFGINVVATEIPTFISLQSDSNISYYKIGNVESLNEAIMKASINPTMRNDKLYTWNKSFNDLCALMKSS